MLNAQCISPKATSTTRWKIPYISENLLNADGCFVPFIGITESWLKGYISDAQIDIPHYTPYRSDRPKRNHGGTLLYVHNSYIVTDHQSYGDEHCNCSILTIDDIKSITAAIYRPPDCSVASFQKILRKTQEYLDAASEQNLDIYITGDFNLPNISWPDGSIDSSLGNRGKDSATALIEFMDKNFLSQVVNCPTRGKNTLDLILTNRVDYICEVESSETCLSDHNIVSATLGFDARRNQSYANRVKETEAFSFYNLNLHDADLDAISSKLSEYDWATLHKEMSEDDKDGSEYAELVRKLTLQACYDHTPTKKPPPPPNKRKQVNRDRRILYRRKRKLRARLRCLQNVNPSLPAINGLRDTINLLAYDIQQSIKHDIAEKERRAVERVKSNPSFFFSYCKRFSKLKTNIGPLRDKVSKTLHHDPEDMANILQTQYTSVFSDPDAPTKKNTTPKGTSTKSQLSNITFERKDIIDAIDEIKVDSATSDGEIPARILKGCKEPLSHALYILWKKSMETSLIPPCYKEQSITPIHKKGSKTDPGNYRPVSLTSHVIKVFERVVRKRLVDYLESNNLISSKQHGFRKGRSCLTQLLQHMDFILDNYQDDAETDVIYLDYAKAFDKVDHELLLVKLRFYGIQGELFDWIEQFLLDRMQKVVVDGKKSRSAPVLSGVPQGTVLGPILFLLYVNDLEAVISHSNMGCFADDTRMSKKITTSSDCDLLQSDLNNVVQWSIDNNMELHEDKFELLVYKLPSNKKLAEDLPFIKEFQKTNYKTPNGNTIGQSHTVRDLGVHLSDDLSWSPHIGVMVDKAKQVASWVLGVFKDRSSTVMLQLYKSLIRSRLEYNSPLWSPSKIGDIQKIEAIQRYFTRQIIGMRDSSYWERMEKLNLMSLQRRRERYSIIHLWKILHNICPNDLQICFKENQRLGMRVVLPALRKKAATSAKSNYDQSFVVRAAKLWNTLPRHVNTADALPAFKTALGNFLDTIPDNPPVSGCTTMNANSIIDWCDKKGGPQQA